MYAYIVKRLLLLIPMTLGITLISFCVMQLAPGQAGGGGGGEMSASRLTTQQQKVMNRTFHLDKPVHHRYLYWIGIWQAEPDVDELRQWAKEDEEALAAGKKPPSHKKGLIYGDFGYSMQHPSVRVWDRLRDAVGISILFNIISIIIIYALSIPIGVYSATHQYSLGDRVSTIGLFMLYSMPSFWVAVLLIKLMVTLPAEWNGIRVSLPFQGIEPENGEVLSTLTYGYERMRLMILPLIVMTYGGIAGLSRYMRSSMIDVIRADYVRTARAKGLREFYVVYKHALRNSLIPIITLLGGLLPGMIGGSLIVEQIFGIPGMGRVAYEALLARDYTVLMADITIVAVLVMVGFLLSDLLYVVADPRIKFDEGK
jgi:peptide/nickel transport system permease protein